MSYYFSTILVQSFETAVAATREALAREGFGVITEIDVRQTMKAKLGKDFRSYVILGACNPGLAYEALMLEDKVGTMLPCNVVVQDLGDDRIEVAAIDPVSSMQAICNNDLLNKAALVGVLLKAAIDRLGGGHSQGAA